MQQPALDSNHSTKSNPTIVLGNQRPPPAAFWFRYKQKVLSHVGTSETLGNGRAGGSEPCLFKPREQPDWEDCLPDRWTSPEPGTLTRGTVADAASCSAGRFGPTSTSEVATTGRLGQHCGRGVSQIKQLLPSNHPALVFSTHLATEENFTVKCRAPHPSKQSLSLLSIRTHSMAGFKDDREEGWYHPAPKHFCSFAAKTRAKIQKEESNPWTAFSRQELRGESETPRRER